MNLRPYQDEAADFLFSNDRAMVLAPVGAGKTAITLTAMHAMLEQAIRVVLGEARGLLSVHSGSEFQDHFATCDNGLGRPLVSLHQCVQRGMR